MLYGARKPYRRTSRSTAALCWLLSTSSRSLVRSLFDGHRLAAGNIGQLLIRPTSSRRSASRWSRGSSSNNARHTHTADRCDSNRLEIRAAILKRKLMSSIMIYWSYMAPAAWGRTDDDASAALLLLLLLLALHPQLTSLLLAGVRRRFDNGTIDTSVDSETRGNTSHQSNSRYYTHPIRYDTIFIYLMSAQNWR